MIGKCFVSCVTMYAEVTFNTGLELLIFECLLQVDCFRDVMITICITVWLAAIKGSSLDKDKQLAGDDISSELIRKNTEKRI